MKLQRHGANGIHMRTKRRRLKAHRSPELMIPCVVGAVYFQLHICDHVCSVKSMAGTLQAMIGRSKTTALLYAGLFPICFLKTK